VSEAAPLDSEQVRHNLKTAARLIRYGQAGLAPRALDEAVRSTVLLYGLSESEARAAVRAIAAELPVEQGRDALLGAIDEHGREGKAT
jgi:hypothetical protein